MNPYDVLEDHETRWTRQWFEINRGWFLRGASHFPAVCARAQTLLSDHHELAGPFDQVLSQRLAARSEPGPYCYWNAGRAILVERAVRKASYVEGLVLYYSSGFFCVEWNGWLELRGRVVDPTALLGRLKEPIYLPVARFSRAEVGDRWDEIPLTLTDAALIKQTCDATTAVYDAHRIALTDVGRALEDSEEREMWTHWMKTRWPDWLTENLHLLADLA